MKILYDASRQVKPARPFAHGVLPTDPVTPAERSRLDSANADWIAVNGGPSHAWELEVRRMLRSLAYPPCNVAHAVWWIGSQGRIDDCPVVEPEDWSAVNAIVARHRADSLADDATGGDIECDPVHWPSWTDLHRFNPTAARSKQSARFHPTPEDSAWWSAECARLESVREDRAADSRAAQSAALDSLTRGLIPRDLAAQIARTSIVGHPE